MKKTFCNQCNKQTEDTITHTKSFAFMTSGGTRMVVTVLDDEDQDVDICLVCALKEIAKAMRLSGLIRPLNLNLAEKP